MATLGATSSMATYLPASAGGSLILLRSASGTNTSSGSAGADSVSITGLTEFDTLEIEISIASVTQTTARPHLWHTTDLFTLTNLFAGGGNLVAGAESFITAKLRRMQSATTRILAYTIGIDKSTNLVGGEWDLRTATTPWTGNWTLSLRHDGVTAGGTFQWSWTVYKKAGQ